MIAYPPGDIAQNQLARYEEFPGHAGARGAAEDCATGPYQQLVPHCIGEQRDRLTTLTRRYLGNLVG